MTTGTIAGVQWSFAYDPENRLMTANKTTGGTVSAAYAYDPLGRRTHKSGTGVSETYFLDDGDDEIAEFNGAGTLNWRYIPGPAVNDPIGSVSGNTGARRFYQTDHHGSLISVVNNAGAQIEGPYIYDSYGNCFSGIQTCAVAGGTPYKFTGMRLDNETGLYYDRARYYSPVLGRFMQIDSAGYKDDLNLYTYSANDPANEADPSGQDAVRCYSTFDGYAATYIYCHGVQDSSENTFLTHSDEFGVIDARVMFYGKLGDKTTWDQIQTFLSELHEGAIIEWGGASHENFKPTEQKASPGTLRSNGPPKTRSSGPILQNEAEAKEVADKNGWIATGQTSSRGTQIYRDTTNNRYYTRDIGGHSPGAWKGAKSPEALESKNTRSGTYDANGNRTGP